MHYIIFFQSITINLTIPLVTYYFISYYFLLVITNSVIHSINYNNESVIVFINNKIYENYIFYL